MEDLSEKIQEEFEKYVISKVGKPKVISTPSLVNSFDAISHLAPKYDKGIGIATDGLWLSFLAELYGLPVSVIKMGRKGKGAKWDPVDELREEELKGKKLIVFDNDVVTGRTLNRLSRELKEYEPSCLDLLLHFDYTIVSPKDYFKWKKYFKPECEIYPSNGQYFIKIAPQIPKEFGKIYSLGDFYKTDEEKTIKKIEEKFKDKYGK